MLDTNAKPVAATATLSPAVTGSGPVNFNAANVPDRTEVDTSAGGQFLFGNLPPGSYAITVEVAGKSCSVMRAGEAGTLNGEWPPTGNETLRVAVDASALTDGLAVQCM